MKFEQFQDMVDRFGEVPTGWPDDIRADALKFLDSSPAAQKVVADAAALRTMFRNDPRQKAPAGLAGRIFAAAALDGTNGVEAVSGRQPRKELFPAARIPHPAAVSNGWRPSYLVFASCFIVGLGLGLGMRFAPLNMNGNIDFATLFAVVGS